AHPIKAMVLEFFQQTSIDQAPVLRNAEGPDGALNAFVNVKSLAVRTDLNAVGCPHFVPDTMNAAVFINPPHLAGVVLPVWIAGIERSIISNCQIVGLGHFITVREYRDRA